MTFLQEVAADVLRTQAIQWVGGEGLSSREGLGGKAGNAAVPRREGGAHTTLGGGLYARMPQRTGGGHGCSSTTCGASKVRPGW